MATTRSFAYNPGAGITGTSQFGNIAIGPGPNNYGNGLVWWNGPDEDLGYIISHVSGDRTTGDGTVPIPGPTVGFWRSSTKTDPSFISLCNGLFNQNFLSASSAKVWLNENGYWTSYPDVTTTSTTTTTTTTLAPTTSTTTSTTTTTTLAPTTTTSTTTTTTLAPTTTTSTTTSTTSSTTTTTTAGPTGAVTFSQAFTQNVAPTTAIETAWNTFRSQLTGSYTQFVWSSTNGNTLTASDPTLVQTLATALRNATGNTSVTINSVVWRVGTGCGTPKIGGVAVEFSNIASCSPSSTYALRPMINNGNWGGTNQYTVGAPSQTITLTFS